MKTTVIILAGGLAKRFGRDKGLVKLVGKPLILHVFDCVSQVADEYIVVVSSIDQKEVFTRLLGNRADVVVNEQGIQSPLIGALAGFGHADGEYSLLIPCDAPFISSAIASMLIDLCSNVNAVIPRWPNGFIEPLQAAYRTRKALDAAKLSLKKNHLNMLSLVNNLRVVKYISTTVLKQTDPDLLTFFNVNTQDDLKKAESILKIVS